MLPTGKINIRDLNELQAKDVLQNKNNKTPLRKRKKTKTISTGKQMNMTEHDQINDIVGNTASAAKKTATKKLLKTAIKETPSNQKRIDSYFTSCTKTYQIKLPKEEPPQPFNNNKSKITSNTKRSASKNTKSPKRPKVRRKRLFSDITDTTVESMCVADFVTTMIQTDCITIDSDSEDEQKIKNEIQSPASTPATAVKNVIENSASTPATAVKNVIENSASDNAASTSTSLNYLSNTSASSVSFGLRMSHTSCAKISSSKTPSTTLKTVTRRKTKPCPPYKIIDNTTFAVDAFQFGYIDRVTHYFLTHFHADHYIGLTKSFDMPLYMSPITARLLRHFIPVQEQYIHELELNVPYIINDIEVTALDANHCPGSILLVFKFPDTGKCILHTGDFRAWFGMESEPIFWNNNIHTIYLDTTYISDKYAFCTQYESVTKAKNLIEQFHEKHPAKRILYICGSYIIGKEKFWSELAEAYDLKVWAEGNRCKALKAMNEERYNKLLVEDANEANMHVIAMGKVTYLELVQYFKCYEHLYDVVFAIRPSGWEKYSKPRYGGKINIVGIEYSEHSSYAEMQRFVKFLKPQHVLSTVPTGRDLMKTAKVPLNWYKYETLKASCSYQPSIDSFMGKTPQRKSSKRPANISKSGAANFVSPLKLPLPEQHQTNNNLDVDETTTIIFSKSTEKEQICDNIKTEITATPALNDYRNSKNATLNTAPATKTTTSKCSVNSSEYFENPDLVIVAKKLQHLKKEGKKKEANKNGKIKVKKSENYTYNTRNLQRTNKELQEKDHNIKETTNSTNSEASDSKKQLKAASEGRHTRETPRGREKEVLRNKNGQSPGKQQQNLEIYTTQTGKMSNGQTVDTAKLLHAAEGELTDINTPMEQDQNLTLNISQKRITRSKSCSIKSTLFSDSSQDKAEREFKAKLLKLTKKSEKIYDGKSQQKFTTISSKTQENPIFKSTTTTSIDSMSEDEVTATANLLQTSNSNQFKSSTLNVSEQSSEETYGLTKSNRLKRPKSKHNSTPAKKSTPNLNTKAILNTILEGNEDLRIDRFNCSQLAGLVLDNMNKQNPDNSKDHIPSDLLSDADEDWM